MTTRNGDVTTARRTRTAERVASRGSEGVVTDAGEQGAELFAVSRVQGGGGLG